MTAHQLPGADVARSIGRDEAMVRGRFGVRGRDWRTQSADRFVIHIMWTGHRSGGITLTANPRLVPHRRTYANGLGVGSAIRWAKE
jgi:hypothetical protein